MLLAEGHPQRWQLPQHPCLPLPAPLQAGLCQGLDMPPAAPGRAQRWLQRLDMRVPPWWQGEGVWDACAVPAGSLTTTELGWDALGAAASPGLCQWVH